MNCLHIFVGMKIEGVKMNTINIEGVVDVNEVPACPICGQTIWDSEIVAIAEVGNRICLIHYYCGDIEFFDA